MREFGSKSKYGYQTSRPQEILLKKMRRQAGGRSPGHVVWNHFEAREFDPVVGRWTSMDPAGQFWSPYNGMGNNPIIRVDPNGKAVLVFDGFDWSYRADEFSYDLFKTVAGFVPFGGFGDRIAHWVAEHQVVDLNETPEFIKSLATGIHLGGSMGSLELLPDKLIRVGGVLGYLDIAKGIYDLGTLVIKDYDVQEAVDLLPIHWISSKDLDLSFLLSKYAEKTMAELLGNGDAELISKGFWKGKELKWNNQEAKSNLENTLYKMTMEFYGIEDLRSSK